MLAEKGKKVMGQEILEILPEFIAYLGEGFKLFSRPRGLLITLAVNSRLKHASREFTTQHAGLSTTHVSGPLVLILSYKHTKLFLDLRVNVSEL